MSRSTMTVKVDKSGLNKLKKQLKGMGYVKVGVLASGDAQKLAVDELGVPSGVTMAEIAAINEFGTLDGTIPARSMIRMPLETKAPDIYKSMKGKTAQNFIANGETDKLLGLLGVQGEIAIQDAFDTRGFGGWAANAPYTIAKKGSSAPLIDTSEFRKSFTSEVVKP